MALLRFFVSVGLIWAFPAGRSARAEEPINVTVLTILASTKKDEVDKRLQEVAEEVQKKHKELKGFTLANIEKVPLIKGKALTYPLVETAVVEVTVNEKPDEEGRVILTIKPPKIAEIKYACCCGKYFPIITDYFTESGDRLIIAIMAKPCKKKP